MSVAATLFETHRPLLDRAVAAIEARDYWSAFPEAPSGRIYGETAKDDGLAAYRARLGQPFALDLPGTRGWIGQERSPYGFDLGITYPDCDLDALLAAAVKAMPAWGAAGPEARAGVVVEIVKRLNARSFEIAYASMYTSGQPFLMAFQAAGPHAQDRALEAIAYAWREMARIPSQVRWEKPQSKGGPLVIEKGFRIVPAGVGVVIGCATFPAWNGYPGLFASLVTGNAVVVKPHPQAILPLAITVEVAREVLRESGFDPNLVTLLADTAERPRTVELVERPEVALVDFTGGPAFGDWLERNLPHAKVFTEKAGVNLAILHSTNDPNGMLRNLATSLCLYSGQMCTTPQNLLVPADGIRTPDGVMPVTAFVAALDDAIRALTADPAGAVELLGTIQSDATLARLEGFAGDPRILIPSRPISHPRYPEARVRTPLLLGATADDPLAGRELFGPVAVLVATDGIDAAIGLAHDLTRRAGAITWVAHSTDDAVVERITDAAAAAGASLAVNLTGPVLVNQSAAYSDYHVNRANPAGNASLTDTAFVAARFRIAQTRRPA
ncbi:phenylacetic acid degradation protein PaaN [Azospirillum endophyticum]